MVPDEGGAKALILCFLEMTMGNVQTPELVSVQPGSKDLPHECKADACRYTTQIGPSFWGIQFP